MNKLWIALFAFLLAGPARAGDPDFSQMTDEQLVDSLQSIRDETVGIDSLADAECFLANGSPPKFAGGVLGTAPPVVYPPMRILVQHGVKSLPVLLNHVDDARPTQLSVPRPGGIIIWSEMAEEYAPRVPSASPGNPLDVRRPEAKLPYTVKVGDVCFALIGQIVGRPLRPVRYQPTGGMIINSPVASSELAQKVRKDWTGLTAADFFNQLIKDDTSSADSETQKTALERLHHFFPEDYIREDNGSVKVVKQPATENTK